MLNHNKSLKQALSDVVYTEIKLRHNTGGISRDVSDIIADKLMSIIKDNQLKLYDVEYDIADPYDYFVDCQKYILSPSRDVEIIKSILMKHFTDGGIEVHKLEIKNITEVTKYDNLVMGGNEFGNS